MGIIALQQTLHDVTATQLLKQPRQTLSHHLLNFFVLVVLIVLVLSTMLLLTGVLLLTAMMLLALPWLLPTMLPGVSTTTILRMLRRRGHVVHCAALEVHIDAAFILFRLVLQSELTADLFDSGLDLLHVIAAVVSLAHDDMQVSLALAPCGLDSLL